MPANPGLSSATTDRVLAKESDLAIVQDRLLNSCGKTDSREDRYFQDGVDEDEQSARYMTNEEWAAGNDTSNFFQTVC